VSDDFYHDDPIEEISKKSLRSKFLSTGVVIVCSIFFLQSTLAGNISLNSGRGIEFGQGVSQAVACSGDTDLTLTPRSTFTNGSPGAHYLQSVTVSNIPTSCYGDDFTINAYNNSSSTPLALFNTTSTNAVVYNNNGTFELGVGILTGASITSGSGTFTITFTNPVALSASVFKLTIQSGVHTKPVYNVGERGPGGGIVFYVSATPFTSIGSTCNTTCQYLEFAPKGWASLSDWPNNIGADGIILSARANVNEDPYLVWSDGAFASVNPGSIAVGQDIGTGYQNTQQILSNTVTSGKSARFSFIAALNYAGAAGTSTTGQWFLPSIKELNELCKYARGQIGALGNTAVQCSKSGTTIDANLGFNDADNIYLSSSYGVAPNEFIAGYKLIYGSDPSISEYYASWGGRVRPVRVF